jgi:hypothetical protein
MRAPKLLLLMLGLGTCSTYLITSGINSEVSMFHAFNDADKKAPVTASRTDTESKDDAKADAFIGGDSFAEVPADKTPSSTGDSTTGKTITTKTGSPVTPSKDRAAAAIAISDGDSVTSPANLSSEATNNPNFQNTSVKSSDETYSKLIAPSLKVKKGARPRLDIAFCIDTTSSMQNEINTVKAKVKSMVTAITKSKAHPIVRVGLVAYRDNGDEYVTKIFEFSENIDRVVRSISDLNADGGGDGPEAVDCGLHDAVERLDWTIDIKTAKLLFLIGDAPPHSKDAKFDWKDEALLAASRGIHINTIGCDGLTGYGKEGFPLYKQISQLTNGTFEPLSYNQQIVDTKGNAATLITVGGKSYVMKSTDKEAWKEDINSLVARGVAAPSLQGATNGTIGVQGSDATYITGVNTAGAVRENNNLDAVMLQGAQSLMSKVGIK